MTDNGVSSYRRFLQGDNRALEALIQTYGDPLLRYIFCYVKDCAAAEDIMEESFAALIVRRKRFDHDGALKAYLYWIARNKSFDYLRVRKRCDCSLTGLEYLFAEESAEGRVLARERDRRVYELLLTLREDYRAVLYLTYYGGLSVEEVGRAMKKNRKQVYNLLARAKANLKEKLIKDGIGYENES